MIIPACGHYSTCPKCNGSVAEYINVVYHQWVQTQASTPPPCSLLVLDVVVTTELEEALREHLCKVCHRCGFGWVEQVATPGSVYEPQQDPCSCDHHGDHLGCDTTCPCGGP